MIRTLFLASVAAFAATAATAQPNASKISGGDHGSKLFARCAACHLADGRGVPGVYPQLAGRLDTAAATEKGRAYLAMTVIAGVMGTLEINGKKIQGIMPAQAGLGDADVAAVLNYALTLKTAGAPAIKTKPKPFTAEEVARIRAAHPKANPNAVHALRAGVFDAAGQQAGTKP
jgi:mono/diheme cytochrome c family protein